MLDRTESLNLPCVETCRLRTCMDSGVTAAADHTQEKRRKSEARRSQLGGTGCKRCMSVHTIWRRGVAFLEAPGVRCGRAGACTWLATLEYDGWKIRGHAADNNLGRAKPHTPAYHVLRSNSISWTQIGLSFPHCRGSSEIHGQDKLEARFPCGNVQSRKDLRESLQG